MTRQETGTIKVFLFDHWDLVIVLSFGHYLLIWFLFYL